MYNREGHVIYRMKIYLKRISATTVALLMALAFVAFGFATLVGSPAVSAVSASSNCTSPTVPSGGPISSSVFNSSFTLQVIGAGGTTITITQSNILSYAACWSYGGFAHGTPLFSDDYGNYTGIPVSYLVGLVGGISPGGSVTVTSGTDNFADTYTYSQVVSGQGWGTLYTATTNPPTPASNQNNPMYLVVAYLWNGSAIGAYACTGTTPCPTGPETFGTGPLRTVTLSSNPNYLLPAGKPWNKLGPSPGINVLRVNAPPPSVPEFGLGGAVLSGTFLAAVLGIFTMFMVRRSYLGRLKQ